MLKDQANALKKEWEKRENRAENFVWRKAE